MTRATGLLIALLLAMGFVSAGVDLNEVGALIVYPSIQAGDAGGAAGDDVESFVTVTNAMASQATIHVSFVNGDSASAKYCYECDFDVALSGFDTETLIVTPNGEWTDIRNEDAGYSPGSGVFSSRTCQWSEGMLIAWPEESIGDPESNNRLFGDQVVVNYTAGYAYSIPAITFQGFGDTDERIFRFGDEYSRFPRILASDFLAPTSGGTPGAELALFTLNFRRQHPPRTDCSVTGFDANENSFSSSVIFGCWERVDLCNDLDPEFCHPNLGLDAGGGSHTHGWLSLNCEVDRDAQDNVTSYDDGNVHGAIIQRAMAGTIFRKGDDEAPAISSQAAFARLLYQSVSQGDRGKLKLSLGNDPLPASTTCGDGEVQDPNAQGVGGTTGIGDEECDDGNASGGDGCDASCVREECGNGLLQAAEECDDGNTSGGDGCDANCISEECGNGVPQAAEDCDDANALNGDGCDENCITEVCGNGVRQIFEDCDDANADNQDGCSEFCRIPMLDPATIQKYVTPLVIPPVMKNDGTDDSYGIAVREFYQQILPAGFPATKVWSYGPAEDEVPAGAAPDPASQFNYPAYTIETTSNVPVSVRWINDLVDAAGRPLPHLLGPVVDQTLHWANPGPTPCVDAGKTTDCTTDDPTPYAGAVPIVPDVHGAHVQGHSDGHPEAWWLPAGVDPVLYDSSGTQFDDATGSNPGNLGYADYSYEQTQPATTLWYHDRTLGMTRLNLYAGPAGFWIVRGGAYDSVVDGVAHGPGVLPGPAPVAGQGVLPLNTPGDPVRDSIREIPIVIQDRSFKADGSLFYPDNRAFFEGLNVAGTDGAGQFPAGTGELQIPFVPASDIAPAWNPDAFFDTIVVNGVTWPTLDVAPALYRLRLLNGCNSRFLNLSLEEQGGPEHPWFQIGGDQGFLPFVVEITTGYATPLPGNGFDPSDFQSKSPDQALLLGLSERADVIVDFRGLPDGTVVRMINTAPDGPFGGFPDTPADPATTGQVMEFVVRSALLGASPTDGTATDPYRLIPTAEPANAAALAQTRALSLNEDESATLCVTVDGFGNTVEVPAAVPPLCIAGGVPMAPRAARLGGVQCVTAGGVPTGTPPPCVAGETLVGVPQGWSDPMTERPLKDDTEQWDIYNLTGDAHPVHLDGVRYQVVNRQKLHAVTHRPIGPALLSEANERGYKDTVTAHPGEVTRVKVTFDIAGPYVWECEGVEQQDNEMKRPYCVDASFGVDSCPGLP